MYQLAYDMGNSMGTYLLHEVVIYMAHNKQEQLAMCAQLASWSNLIQATDTFMCENLRI